MSIPRIPRKIPTGPDVDRFLSPDPPAKDDTPAPKPEAREGREGKRSEAPKAKKTARARASSRPKKAAAPKAAKVTGASKDGAGDWRELLGGPSIATSIRVPMELQEKLRDAAHYLDGWDMTRILVEGAARLVVELDTAVGGIPERPELRKVELD